MRRKANRSIPSGWALGLDGNPTIDPEEVSKLKDGCCNVNHLE